MAPEPVTAIVVAAGAGVRMGGGPPKALLRLGGRTLIEHSVAALAAGGVARAVVVVPPDGMDDFAAELSRTDEPNLPIPCELVAGGATRQESVARGLAAIDTLEPGCRVVIVHDAARPLVPPSVVARVIEAVTAGAKACAPVLPVPDSVRRLTASGSEVVDREPLRLVQTPQAFDRAALAAAHERLRQVGSSVTDDASAMAALGFGVELVDGSPESMKITTPFDLTVATAIEAGRR